MPGTEPKYPDVQVQLTGQDGKARQVLADDANVEVHADSAAEMAASILALHDWLSNGGFFPAAWMASRVPTPEQRDRGYRTDAGHEFEPMPGDDTCMYVLASGARCMKYAGDHR